MAASDADSREKLADDVLRFVRELTDEALVMGAHEASWYPNIGGLRECIAAYLDRQDAITRHELDGECEFCQSEVARLQGKMDELTADRDRLGKSCWKLESELAEKKQVCDIQRESFRKMEADLAATRHVALALWRRMDALRMAGIVPSKGDLDALAARLAEHGIEAS